MSGTFSRARRAITPLATWQNPWPTCRPSRGSGPLAGWQTWAPEGACGDQPALLITAALRVPIPEARLSAPPGARPGDVNVAEAKRAVATVCRRINATAAPMVPAVQESCRGSWR
jgi:hypothetical protein